MQGTIPAAIVDFEALTHLYVPLCSCIPLTSVAIFVLQVFRHRSAVEDSDIGLLGARVAGLRSCQLLGLGEQEPEHPPHTPTC